MPIPRNVAVVCFPTVMRFSLWLILILAFSVGMGCAFVIRTLHFEAKPVVTQSSEPRAKILVATRTIPSGVEITAELLAFQEVTLSEVPLMALTDFSQVYRRQAAYSIPADCPICEDLLLPRSESVTQAAFVPTGSQFVTLDVEYIRQGDRVFSPTRPLSTVLADKQQIDIWVIPVAETQGRFAEMKNEVLRTHATQDRRNEGQLLLECVPIHQIQRRAVADQEGAIRDSVVVLLDKNEGTKLAAAAKRGQIRLHPRPNEESAPLQTTPLLAEVEPAVVEQPQDIALEVPAAWEQPTEQPLVPMQLPLTSVTESVVSLVPAPMSADALEAILSPAPIPTLADTSFPVVRELRNLDFSENSSAADSPSGELTSSRNDAPANSFIGTPRRISPAERFVGQLVDSEPVISEPRATHTLQFVTPEQVASAQELAKRPEVTPSLSTPPPTTPPPALSSAVPISPRVVEKKTLPTYSPFEQRRVYTVQPSQSTEESSAELHIPPRLWRSSDTGLQTQ